MTTPSGRISNEPEEREKEREKMPFIVATYVYASSQGQRMHSARTNEMFVIKTNSNADLQMFSTLSMTYTSASTYYPQAVSLVAAKQRHFS